MDSLDDLSDAIPGINERCTVQFFIDGWIFCGLSGDGGFGGFWVCMGANSGCVVQIGICVVGVFLSDLCVWIGGLGTKMVGQWVNRGGECSVRTEVS
jgi:hypothetical protein